ncbi:MAG: porin family protein [Hyphomicrobiales bacterium]|nr:porin family protein [Hyphomicrobiales bacterium]
MGSLKATLLSGAAVLFVTSAAQAADLLPPAPRVDPPVVEAEPDFSGWYIRGDVGIGSHRSLKMRSVPDPMSQVFPNFVPTSYNILPAMVSGSPFVSVGVGYQINSWFRADLTAEYRTATFSSQDQLGYNNGVAAPNTSSSVLRNFYRGNIGSMVYLLNGYIDLGTWSGVTPYVGAGIGFARQTMFGATDNGYSNTYAGPGAGSTANTSGNYKTKSTTSFAWALMAGASYNVNSRLKLDIGYRYLNMGEVRSAVPSCNAFGPGLQNCDIALRIKRGGVHDMRIGFRWLMSDPAPRPAPAPAPIVRKY